MAFQYWRHRGKPERNGFICLRDAYHGDTIGSVSVGGIDLFHACFGPLLFDAWQAEPGDAAHMAALLREHAGRVAAVIVEPLVQGAAGILTHPDGYLAAVRALCDEHDVLLICDEVATGFGRTGTMFACEQEDVAPDLMCVAKGLTGGYMPLAATLASERIYEAFLGEHEELRTFFHGHTYTANPLACAAALATLDVFEPERTLEALRAEDRAASRAARRARRAAALRRRGAPARVHGRHRAREFPLEARMGHQVTLAARRRGAVVRPLGDVVVLMPPLAMSEEEICHLVQITAASVAEATARPVLLARRRSRSRLRGDERERPHRAAGPADEPQRRDDDDRAGHRQLVEVGELGQPVAAVAEQVVVDRERRVEAAGRAGVDADGLDAEAGDVALRAQPQRRPRRPARA